MEIRSLRGYRELWFIVMITLTARETRGKLILCLFYMHNCASPSEKGALIFLMYFMHFCKYSIVLILGTCLTAVQCRLAPVSSDYFFLIILKKFNNPQ